ncbi:MAG TPA: hypothetical protein VFL97_10775 [Nitrococcus sp.]|nr:hypothetical protein [Nitrococcus sp.]
MLRLMTLAGLFGGALLSGAAQAVMVDLTDSSWSQPQYNHQTSVTRTYGTNQVTLSSDGTGKLNFTPYDGGKSTACGKLHCALDGVGINDDEISYGKERLTASFSSAVTLNSVQFLDLFGKGHPGDPLAEGAAMLIDFAGGGQKILTAFGTDLSEAGYLDSAVGLSDILSITFFTDATQGLDLPANSDFALAGLDLAWADGTDPNDPAGLETNDLTLNDPPGPTTELRQPLATSIPEPGLLWLMLIGLISLGVTGAQARRLPVPSRNR